MSQPKLLALVLVVGCSSGPTKEESLQVFVAASTAMSSAQSKAVADAKSGSPLTAPADLALDFSGPCTLGGAVAVTGSYAADGNGDHAAFDLQTSFNGCKEPTGTLDGNLRWSSVATGTSFTATMDGELDWAGNDGSASCDFDLTLTINDFGISYGGSLCGYDVATELTIGPRS